MDADASATRDSRSEARTSHRFDSLDGSHRGSMLLYLAGHERVESSVALKDAGSEEMKRLRKKIHGAV